MRRLPILLLMVATIAPAGARAELCGPGLLPSRPAEPRALTFGVTAAGQVFGNVRPRVPDIPPLTIAALDGLRASGPLLVRINRIFYADGVAGIDRVDALARTYTDRGHLVTLQLRYGPFGGLADPSPEGYAGWVRAVVARLGANPGVVAAEVTNEPNFTTAPQNSDGAFPGVIEALTRGVIAAADERDARGYAQLKIGFTWFHEMGPVEEEAFWTAVGQTGGHPFHEALDWVGLNAFPGTYDFLATPPGMEGDEMVRALAKLRACYLPMVGVPHDTPIRVTENAFPDGFGREPLLADTLERMVRAVHAHAGAYNVTHYLWFTLRDVNSGALSFESNYGLLNDDYAPKAAYGRYRDLIAELG